MSQYSEDENSESSEIKSYRSKESRGSVADSEESDQVEESGSKDEEEDSVPIRDPVKHTLKVVVADPVARPVEDEESGYQSDLAKFHKQTKVEVTPARRVDNSPPTEPKLKGMFRVRLINDEGVEKPWEDKFIALSKGGLIMKETEKDRIVRGNLHLYDFVFCEPAEEYLSDETPYILKLKTRSRSTWIFVLDSRSTQEAWIDLISTNMGKMSEEEWSTPLPPAPSAFKATKDNYTLKTFVENRRLYGGLWMIFLFFAWIAVLAVMFALLWKLYVAPYKDMKTETTSCFVLNQDVNYVLKKNYDIVMDVRYDVNGTSTLSTMHQRCQGLSCPDRAPTMYPVNEYTTCYYDINDIDYVFFDKSPMMNTRYQITFGVCGGLLAPWLIFCVTMIYVRRSWIVRVMKNGCW